MEPIRTRTRNVVQQGEFSLDAPVIRSRTRLRAEDTIPCLEVTEEQVVRRVAAAFPQARLYGNPEDPLWEIVAKKNGLVMHDDMHHGVFEGEVRAMFERNFPDYRIVSIRYAESSCL